MELAGLGILKDYNALKTQGNTYLNGDVGIGTDSPFGKLTVNTQNVGWNFPSLLLIDDAIDNTGGAILQFRNPVDKRMYLQSHFGTQSDGTDSYMTFSHNAFYNMRLRGDGNLGIGSLNPNLAGLVVNKKVGNSHAIFGDNTSGVSIESNFPGIHFNSYFNGSRKTISTGYTAGAEMNPTTGDFSIYTSPASTTAGNTASVFERLKITKDGVVNVAGKMKLGDDLTTPTAGTMRYNPTTNDFEGFDGNVWKSFTQPTGFWGTLNNVVSEVKASSVIPYGDATEGSANAMISDNYMAVLFKTSAAVADVVTKFYKWESNNWVYMHQLPGNLIGKMTDDWILKPNVFLGSNAIVSFSLYKRTANTWAFHSNIGSGLAAYPYGKKYAIDGDKFVVMLYGALGSTTNFIDIYKFNGTGWALSQTLTDPSPAVNNEFGTTLSLKNDFIGAGYESTNPIETIVLYKYNGTSFVTNSNISEKYIEEIYYEGTDVRVKATTGDFFSYSSGGIYKINTSGFWELIPNSVNLFNGIDGFILSSSTANSEEVFTLNKFENGMLSQVCNINYGTLPNGSNFGYPHFKLKMYCYSLKYWVSNF